jgi:hypothetical protein
MVRVWMVRAAAALMCLAAAITLTGATQPGERTTPHGSANAPLRQGADAAPQSSQMLAAKPGTSAASTVQKRKIAAQSAQLLQMATELKAEVDKTSKDVLSVSVVRKADAIEKLAREVVAKTKATDGSS